MINFIKGLVTGMGGISPGFSGSILLVMFGLYEKTLEAIVNIVKDFKKNFFFLLPLLLGMGAGFVLFGTIFSLLIENAESYTRYASLGLVLGTIPLLHKEAKKKDFKKSYYIIVLVAFLAGVSMFVLNNDFFAQVTDPNFFQSILIGVAIAGSAIIPGVNGAVILSALGVYEVFTASISIQNFSMSTLEFLIPVGIGGIIGGLVIAYIMYKLLKNFYGIVFAVILGLFVSMIPTVLDGIYLSQINTETIICIALAIVRICYNV